MTTKESKDMGRLEMQQFQDLERLTSAVVKGYRHGLIVEGDAGVGKSHNILKVLKQSKTNYLHLKGHLTPMHLAKLLYQHKDADIVFIDDCDELLHNKATKAMLKQILDTPPRTCRWDSSRGKLPSEWPVNFKIILAGNKYPSDINFRAVRSRCFYYKISFTHEEKLAIIEQISKLPYKKLKLAERELVVGYLKSHSNPAHRISLRTYEKLCDLYAFGKSTKTAFADLARLELKEDQNLRIVATLANSGLPVKEQIEKFKKSSNLGRASYFKLKKETV